jgi:16S rRNA processing protein RimM
LRAPDRLILMGVFGAPQGVRGEIRVKSMTGEPRAIGDYGPLTDKGRTRALKFDSLRALKDDMLVARVAGISTRDAAEALKGVEIFARRDQLPPPSEDEFYYEDLVGLEAVDAVGGRIGRVVSLMNYGAGDVLEIAPAQGGETLLLAFTKRVAPRIDFDAGRIVIEPPREVEDED